MFPSKIVPSNENTNPVSTTEENTQLGRNTIFHSNKIDMTVLKQFKQADLALEVEILVNNGEEGNTIYKLRGSTLDWLMLVDCDFGRLSKFVIRLIGLWVLLFL